MTAASAAGVAGHEEHVCSSVLKRTGVRLDRRCRCVSSAGVGACLVLGVVGDVQRLNLAEDLVAFGVIGGELVEMVAESVQLEDDALAANLGFRGQTGRSLCGTMSALRFECEFRLASIRNDLFSGSALLWCQAPLGCLLQAMDEFGTSPWSTGVRALAYDGKLRFQLPCGEVLAPRPSGPMGAPPLQR